MYKYIHPTVRACSLYIDDLKVKVNSLSSVQLLATPWTVAYQAPLSMGFSRQEYWSGLPFSSPEDLPDPGIEPKSPTLQAGSLPSDPPSYPYQTGSDSKALYVMLGFCLFVC